MPEDERASLAQQLTGMHRNQMLERLGRPIGRSDQLHTLIWPCGSLELTAVFKNDVVETIQSKTAATQHSEMAVQPGHVDGFGCALCMNPELGPNGLPDGVLALKKSLVDDSHFIVKISACTKCGQDFLHCFTETIDWTGGDDAQYRDLVPLTVTEAALLERASAADMERTINGLNMSRPHINMSYPTGGTKSVTWKRGGILVSPHD